MRLRKGGIIKSSRQRLSTGSYAKLQRGLTLIELLIVIVVIAILAGIAYPSYTNIVIRNNRAVAKAALVDIAARQESFYSQTKTYANGLNDLGYPSAVVLLRKDGGFTTETSKAAYRLGIRGTSSNRAFIAEAIPVSGLLTRGDKECGTLSINAQGVKDSQYGGDKCF